MRCPVWFASLLVAGAAACGTSQPAGGPSGDDGTADGGSGAGNSSGSGGASSGSSSGGGASGGSGGSSSGSSGNGSGSSSGDSGVAADDGGACTIAASTVRVTEIDVGLTYVYQEIDSNGGDNIGLAPLAISPMPKGGSRVAFMGSDGMVHIAQLDANDQLVAGSIFGLPAFDFQDLYADDAGGVVLVSRNAVYGMGTGNCGTPSNLCGTPPSPPDPCFDMFMVRFDGTKQTWATELTQSGSGHPPYLNSPTDPNNLIYIWWYAHNGRIAFDGSNYAGYFGAAISVSQSGCVNIHQGDRMQIVDGAGALQSGGFDWGCSHSGYERIVWDGSKFVTVCKNDAPTGGKSGRLAFAPDTTTIDPVDLYYSDFGSVLTAGGGGYWLITSDIRAGQTPNADGLADIHLLHTTTGTPDKDLTLASDTGLNDRAPHLAPFGTNRMLAAWETSTQTGDLDQNDTSRKLYVQALNATSGTAQSGPYYVPGVTGSRYQDFRTYPDGSVAYAAPGSSGTKIKILRVLPCP